MDTSNLVRLELLVAPEIKAQVFEQAIQANESIALYGGRLLSKKIQSFAEAANSTSRLATKLDAVIATLNSIERSIYSKK
jgi:hypothetical protein